MARHRHPRIGAKIRRAMEVKRMDQGEVAAALGVSRSAVNAWINDRMYPQNSIGALEELLGVSFDADDHPGLPPPRQALLDQMDEHLAALDEIKRQLREYGSEPGGEHDEDQAPRIREA